MKVERNIDRDGNICTPLHALLEIVSNEDQLMFYSEHDQRHPHAIYNVSFQRFKNSYIKLIDYLQSQSIEDRMGAATDLYVNTKEVIESIDAFVDDIYLIMKCFIPKCEVKKNIVFADKWLEKYNFSIVNNYKNNIKFVEPMQLAVNKFRHNHGEIHPINARTEFGEVFGFFIMSAGKDGTLIPCPDIHKLYRGKYTAFSYNRFLIEAFADIYLVSSQAEKALISLLKKQAGYDYMRKSIDINSTDYIFLIEHLYATLTNVLFEDEYERCPQVDWDGKVLTVRDLSDRTYMKRFKRPDFYAYRASTSGDGYTKTFGLPYLGDN